MMSMKSGWRTAAIAAVAMGCADATGIRPIGLEGAFPTVTTETYNTFPAVGPYTGLTWGDVQLCKTTPAGSPAATFTFSVTASEVIAQSGKPLGTPVAAPSIDVPAGGGTVCAVVYSSVKHNAGLDQVIVTENTPPTNWALTSIDTKRITFTGVTYPAPRLDDSEDFAGASATLYINEDMARIVTFTNTYTPPPVTGGEGCTPGYWKQPHHLDSWDGTGYAPGDDFDSVFGVDLFSPDVTLLQALGLNGGGVNALARHAVAALLNAASGFYPMTEAEVVAAVQGATSKALIESAKNTLAGNNELGCPLN